MRLKGIKEKYISNLFSTKKEVLQDKLILFLLGIRMTEETLKFDNIRVNKNSINLNNQSI